MKAVGSLAGQTQVRLQSGLKIDSRKRRHKGGGYLFLSVSLLCLQLLLSAKAAELDPVMQGFQKFDNVYEPSGVIQLQDGRLLVVEDESSRAFVLLTPQAHSTAFDVDVLKPRVTFASLLSGSSGQISDLEGLVQGPNEYIYAITSHSRQGNGKRDAAREKLVRLTIDGDKIGQINIRTNLRKAMIKEFPELKAAAKERDVKEEAGLNIEGLTFNRNKDALWIGFRGPLVDDKAIVISLINPKDVFDTDEKFKFEKKLQLLDLDGGGIRDIVFDSTLDGYLVVSQREGTKKEKAFKLWFWEGSSDTSPRRVRINGVKNLRRTEGVAGVSLQSKDLLLLVSDEGDAVKRNSADVLLVNYDDLEID